MSVNGDDRQERVWRARLLALPPAEVFAEIKTEWGKPNDFPGRDSEALEEALLQRDDRLVDLALAGYGQNRAVVSELYRRCLQSAARQSPIYTKDLRIACLSNRNVTSLFVHRFPQELLGDAETARVVADGEWEEVDALMNNPKLDVDLIEALYKGEGIFSGLPDTRRCHLVYSSATNTRINTDYSNRGGPDLGHYRIHESVVTLLERAPRTKAWLNTLYHLLDQIDASQVAWPKRLEPLLRWPAEEPAEDEDETQREGYFTRLPLTDEFRCLIASFYGRSLQNRETKVWGTPDADDVALRCAY